jgi:hypothetical protein
MIDRIVTILGASVGFALLAMPAMAIEDAGLPLPEPATMSLFGLGVAGAFIARKLINRK